MLETRVEALESQQRGSLVFAKATKFKASPVIYATPNDSNLNPKHSHSNLMIYCNDLFAHSFLLSTDKESAV